MPSKRILVRNVSKIFGEAAGGAPTLPRNGAGKKAIPAETGAIVGLGNASFDISKGEILIVMALSGSGKSTVLIG